MRRVESYALTRRDRSVRRLSATDSHAHHSRQLSGSKSKWSLTPEAFEKLLGALSSDRNEAGVQYEIVRRKLTRFFEWRKVEAADDYADETINRVARRIAEGQVVENLGHYFYGVARLVFLEAVKQQEHAAVPLDDAPQNLQQIAPAPADPEPRILCFDRCLDSLPADNRRLIVNYYQEERRAKIELRQELADSLHIPLNALRIRAHRIRVRLEQCIAQCLNTPVSVK
jgi:DNA-directed RNA polymerase specialized sigma24 family protein